MRGRKDAWDNRHALPSSFSAAAAAARSSHRSRRSTSDTLSLLLCPAPAYPLPAVSSNFVVRPPPTWHRQLCSRPHIARPPASTPRLSIFPLHLLPSSSSSSSALLPTPTFEPSIITPSDALSRALPLNYSTLPTLLLSLPLSGRCHSFRRRATSSAAAYY